MPRFNGIPLTDEEVANVNKATPKGPRFQQAVTPQAPRDPSAPPSRVQYIPPLMPDPTPAQLAEAGRRQAAQETGPLQALLIGMGRTGDRMVEGARDLYDMPMGLMGDMQAKERRRLRAEEQARATELYRPLSEEHPIATTFGESVPYMVAPSAGLAARGAGMDAARAAFFGNVMVPGLLGFTEYGTPQERLERGGAAAAAGYAANALARVAGGRAVDTGDEYLDDVIRRGQRLGFEPLPSDMARDRNLQILEAGYKANPRTASMIGELEDRNTRRLTKIAADAIGLENVDRLTPFHLQKARDDIGQMFESAAQNVTIKLTPEFKSKADDVFYDYIQTPGRSADKAMSNRLVETIDDLGKRGSLSADEYLKFSSDLAKDARGLRARGENAAADALDELRDRLDEAFDGSAGNLKQLKTARDRWRSLLMIEDTVTDAGDVSFLKLGNQLRKKDKWGYKRGNKESELYDAIRFYNVFPRPFGRPGTAEALQGAQAAGGGGFFQSVTDGMTRGAGLGYMVGQPEAGMALGGLYGAAKPVSDRVAARLYTSRLLNRGLMEMSPEAQGLLGRSAARAGLLAITPYLQSQGLK